MLKINYLIIALIFITQLTAKEAQSNYDAQFNTQCPLTPAIWDDTPFIGKIVKSNNLRKKTGSSYFAEGEFINITGKVLDGNCVPVAEAVIEIWQADAFGNIVPTSNKTDKNFAYTGTAITDNLGQYNFFTVFPGVVNKQAPRIHFKVKHPDFLPFESYMYFPNNNLNDSDLSLRNIPDRKERNLLISTYIETFDVPETYSFNVTLEGVNKYKRY